MGTRLTYSGLILLAALALGLSACSDAPIDATMGGAADMPAEHPVAADLVPTEEGKSDGYGRNFDHNRLMDDDVFEDANYLSEEEIQAFLENTPYGTRSFLAEYVAQGESVSEMLHSAATEYGINPIVLITKLQVETSLIFQTVAPSTFTINRAMGCGCPDGDPACSRAPKGLGRQIRCGARLFRQYLDELGRRNRTISGWGKGIPKKSLEGTTIVPSNLATAALYTYTPWVLVGQGGNWLYWNVLRKFSRHILKSRPNHRWIGAPCSDESECGFQDARCVIEDRGNGPLGFCTLDCDSVCPDLSQPYTAQTVCAFRGQNDDDGNAVGLCVSRCDDGLFPDTGCPLGFTCVDSVRPNEPDKTISACLRGDETTALE